MTQCEFDKFSREAHQLSKDRKIPREEANDVLAREKGFRDYDHVIEWRTYNEENPGETPTGEVL